MRYLPEDKMPEVFIAVAGVIRRMKYTEDQINDPEFVARQLTRIFDHLYSIHAVDDGTCMETGFMSAMLEYEALAKEMKFITHHAKDAFMRHVQERRAGFHDAVIPEARYCANPDCTEALPFDAPASRKYCATCQVNGAGRKLSALKYRKGIQALKQDIK